MNLARLWDLGLNKALNKSSPPTLTPIPVILDSPDVPGELLDFLLAPEGTQRDIPWQAATVKEELLRRDVTERHAAAHAISMSAVCFQLAQWTNDLVTGYQELSRLTLQDILRTISVTLDACAPANLATVRPVLDRAVDARLSLRREALREFPDSVRQRVLRADPGSPDILPRAALDAALSSQPL